MRFLAAFAAAFAAACAAARAAARAARAASHAPAVPVAALRAAALPLAALVLSGCLGTPRGVRPVEGLDLERYMGTWYEIARLDHRFERGLEAVQATYELQEDGDVRVLNRGYDPERGEWKEAEGVARLAAEPGVGHLAVSFFGPFFSSYVIFELEREAYTHAFVSGFSHSYLWLLAREPAVSDSLRTAFVERARGLGFETDGLIWVDQSRNTGSTP